MNDEEYRRAEARLEEALAIFAEREAQFSNVLLTLRDNVAKVRADVAAMRARRGSLQSRSSESPP